MSLTSKHDQAYKTDNRRQSGEGKRNGEVLPYPCPDTRTVCTLEMVEHMKEIIAEKTEVESGDQDHEGGELSAEQTKASVGEGGGQDFQGPGEEQHLPTAEEKKVDHRDQ